MQIAYWIWSDLSDLQPVNRFTYFRRVVTVSEFPQDATLWIAADSTAKLWINGHVVRRKVSRFHEDKIRLDRVDAGPFLQRGENVIVVLHHNWGPITTFQRTENVHAGLYLQSEWLVSDGSWQWRTASEFLPHDRQILGAHDRTPRLRFPQVLNLAERPSDLLTGGGKWKSVALVLDGPWPAVLQQTETPAQREFPVEPLSLLGAGEACFTNDFSDDPAEIGNRLSAAVCEPSLEIAKEAGRLLAGSPAIFRLPAGRTVYLTFDFGRPVHGYPFAEVSTGASIEMAWGYAEIIRSTYNGSESVQESGWLDCRRVTGDEYADRVLLASGENNFEIPDERTARWFTVHLRARQDTAVTLRKIGFISSQYPVEIRGSFDCGDFRMNQIVQLALVHAQVTMTDAYVDTPGREDGQWIEDAQPRAALAARWFGDHKLRRFLLRTVAESEKGGEFHPFPPSNFPAFPAAFDWAVQWVQILSDEYLWSGDTALVREHWDTLVRFWQHALQKVDDEGVFRTNHIFADIRVGAHPAKPDDSSGIVSAWMIDRLAKSIVLARAVGEEAQAAAWGADWERMRDAFRRRHMVQDPGSRCLLVNDVLSSGSVSTISQTGQLMSVLTGLFSEEESRAALDHVFQDPCGGPPVDVLRWNNPTNLERALSALSLVGREDRAVRHLFERFSPYLPHSPRNSTSLTLQGPLGGPLPEYWISHEDRALPLDAINDAQPMDPTGSHGWGAVALLWLHESLLGVRLASPGGGELTIAPKAGGLPYVAGWTATPRGCVWVGWYPAERRLRIELPVDVTAEVALPLSHRSKAIAGPGRFEWLDNPEF